MFPSPKHRNPINNPNSQRMLTNDMPQIMSVTLHPPKRNLIHLKQTSTYRKTKIKILNNLEITLNNNKYLYKSIFKYGINL